MEEDFSDGSQASHEEEDSDGFSAEEDEVKDDEEEDISWINWFCSLKGNEFFCTLDEEYLEDEFNLHGLKENVVFFDYALDVILDLENPIFVELDEKQQKNVESAADSLYGLLHSRYILSKNGMQKMENKFINGDFGFCPRVSCRRQHCLPVGNCDIPGKESVRIFCPRCRQTFMPNSKHLGIDGAYWGSTFPHLFLFSFPEHMPPHKDYFSVKNSFIPRVFGFKLNRFSNKHRKTQGKIKKKLALMELGDFGKDCETEEESEEEKIIPKKIRVKKRFTGKAYDSEGYERNSKRDVNVTGLGKFNFRKE